MNDGNRSQRTTDVLSAIDTAHSELSGCFPLRFLRAFASLRLIGIEEYEIRHRPDAARDQYVLAGAHTVGGVRAQGSVPRTRGLRGDAGQGHGHGGVPGSRLQRLGAEVVTPIAAWANPSGPVDGNAYDRICEAICNDVAKGCDAVLLDLHGAMVVANRTDDGEGTLLEKIRAVAPRTPIAVSLDLHANVTERMVRNCDVITGYKTYPHVDQYESGELAGSHPDAHDEGRGQTGHGLGQRPDPGADAAPEHCRRRHEGFRRGRPCGRTWRPAGRHRVRRLPDGRHITTRASAWSPSRTPARLQRRPHATRSSMSPGHRRKISSTADSRSNSRSRRRSAWANNRVGRSCCWITPTTAPPARRRTRCTSCARRCARA